MVFDDKYFSDRYIFR